MLCINMIGITRAFRLCMSRSDDTHIPEQFSNGITVMFLYLRPLPGSLSTSRHPPIEASIHQIMKEISLLYCIPQNPFRTQFASSRLSLQETTYAHCMWVFVSHFLNRLGNDKSTMRIAHRC